MSELENEINQNKSEETKVTDKKEDKVEQVASKSEVAQEAPAETTEETDVLKIETSDEEDGFSLDEINEGNYLVPKRGGNPVRLLKWEVVYRENSVTKQPIKAVEFTYESVDETSKGALFKFVIFEPKRQNELRDANDRKMVIGTLARLKHVFNAYKTEEVCKDEELNKTLKGWNNTISFADFIASLSKNVTPDFNKIKSKVKAVYKKGSNFPSIPNFPPFISTTLKPREFSYNPEFDLLEIVGKKPTEESGESTDSGFNGGGWV